MKTKLQFLDSKTNKNTSCADHFEIQVSSRDLNWNGILLEKGTASHFTTKDVVTPYFFFSMELKNDFSWNVKEGDSCRKVHTQINDIWINPPFTPFSHKNDNAAEFLALVIHEDILFKYFDGYLPKDDLQFLRNYSIQDGIIENMLNILLLEVMNHGSNGDGFIENFMKLFSNYFISNYSNLEELTSKVSYNSVISQGQLIKIDEYIRDNISDLISIDKLAGTLHMNKFHFLNEFKKLTGLTPYQYILSLKLQEAKTLLESSNDTLTNIALRLGFSDSSHFTRTFKKAFNETPYSYRKNKKVNP